MSSLERKIRKGNCGYLLVVVQGAEKITAIEVAGEGTVRLGDFVVSNGRFAIPKGIKGVVCGLTEPGTDGLTSNVLAVRWFNGDQSRMKLKDIQLLESSPLAQE